MASELSHSFVVKHCVKDQMPLPDRVLSTDVRGEKVCGESVRNLTHLWICVVQSTILPLLEQRNNSSSDQG